MGFHRTIRALRACAAWCVWLALAGPSTALGQTTVTWNGSTDATWSQPDATSWSGATYQSGNTALFNGSGTGVVTIDAGGVTPGLTNVTGGSYTFTGGAISGTGGITKAGTGTLTLASTNTYSGTTTLSNGTLALGNAAALGSGVLRMTGGTLTATTPLTGANKVTNNMLMTSGAIGGSNAIELSGTFTNSAGSLAINNTGGTTFSGPMWILSGTANASLTFSGSSDFTISGPIGRDSAGASGTSLGNLTYAGSGVLTLSGSNTFGGATSVYGGGAVSFANEASLGRGILAVGGNNSAGTLRYTGNGESISRGLRLGNSTGQQGMVGILDQSGSGLLAYASVTTTGTNAGTPSVDATLYLQGSTSGTGQITGSVSGGSGGVALAVVKRGSGVWLLPSNASSYRGQLAIEEGTLSSGTINNLNANGPLGNSGLAVLMGGTAGTAGRFTYTGGSASSSKPFTLVAGGTGVFDVANAATTLTISGLVSGSGALVKDGQGKLTLSGSNTYSGPTVIVNGGTLQADAAGALPTANGRSAVSLDATGSGSSTLALGVAQTIASLSGAASSTVNLGASTLRIGMTSGTSIFAGGISGVGGSIVKDGESTLVLSGSSSYTGGTDVTGGLLAVNGSIAGAVTVAGGATLGGSGSIGGSLSGSGLIAPGNSPGILTATSIDPSSGLQFAFEFTQANPNYASPFASGNDVLSLTGGTPFLSSLTSANAVDIYLAAAVVDLGTLTGGFFTADAGDFLTNIAGGNFRYFVQSNSGTYSYNGLSYQTLNQYDASKTVSVSTVAANGGQVTQFVIVPEPATIICAAIGISLAAWSGWKRRRSTRINSRG
jgi:fibronectin-binding autotransporter adhesin